MVESRIYFQQLPSFVGQAEFRNRQEGYPLVLSLVVAPSLVLLCLRHPRVDTDSEYLLFKRSQGKLLNVWSKLQHLTHFLNPRPMQGETNIALFIHLFDKMMFLKMTRIKVQ